MNTPHKRGFVRADGLVFAGGGRWIAAEQFEAELATMREERTRKRALRLEAVRERTLRKRALDARRARADRRKAQAAALPHPSSIRQPRPPLTAEGKILANRINSRAYKAFARHGVKPPAIERLLGCSVAQAVAYISRRFAGGMSWENPHLWEIRHTHPARTSATQAGLTRLFHYTNLRPVWCASVPGQAALRTEDT